MNNAPDQEFDASKELGTQTPTPAEVTAEIAKTVTPAARIVENSNGSWTIDLAYPPDLSRFTPQGMTYSQITQITLNPIKWKERREAEKKSGPGASNFDAEVAMLIVMTGQSEVFFNELDARDMSLLQYALGKLLFSPQLPFGG